MKKAKIVFLIPRLGSIDRGAEIFVYELSRILAESFNVSVWVGKSQAKSGLLSGLEKDGVEVKKFGCFTEASIWAQVPSCLIRSKLYREKFHITPSEMEMLFFSLACLPGLFFGKFDILFPNNGFWGALICALVRFVKGTPFVYTSHGGIEPLIARLLPDCYFALNKTIERHLRRYFPKQNVVFVPNGVNLKRFIPFGKKLGLDLERPIFLSASALIPVKRVDLAIKAVAKLKEGSLLVLGDGPLRNELEGLGGKLLGKKRFMIKTVRAEEMSECYRSADVFTLAAQNEPGSLVHLEAMACNLPLVVNDEAHLRFLVGKAGILVDTNDVSSYANALKSASERDFGFLPRQQAEKFGWRKIGAEYLRELNEYQKK